jgi:hypothetical protein
MILLMLVSLLARAHGEGRPANVLLPVLDEHVGIRVEGNRVGDHVVAIAWRKLEDVVRITKL